MEIIILIGAALLVLCIAAHRIYTAVREHHRLCPFCGKPAVKWIHRGSELRATAFCENGHLWLCRRITDRKTRRSSWKKTSV